MIFPEDSPRLLGILGDVWQDLPAHDQVKVLGVVREIAVDGDLWREGLAGRCDGWQPDGTYRVSICAICVALMDDARLKALLRHELAHAVQEHILHYGFMAAAFPGSEEEWRTIFEIRAERLAQAWAGRHKTLKGD